MELVHTFKRARSGEAAPMMLVPVFIILIAFFGFMAVRNEMIKDEIRETEAAIGQEERALKKVHEEYASRLSTSAVSLTNLTADPDAQLAKRRKEIAAARAEAAEESKREASFMSRREALTRKEGERRQELDDLRAELDQLRRDSQRGPDMQPVVLDPAEELFTRAEAESVLVLRRHGLAVTNLKVYPVSQVIIADLLYLRNTSGWFQARVNEYYSSLSALEIGEFDQRWAFYQTAKDRHADLRDDRTTLLKSLKSAIDELTEIERATNRDGSAQGIGRKYIPVYIPLLEEERKTLRDIECKPPAEPLKRIRVR